MLITLIKSVSCEYSCNEQYLEEIDKGNFLKFSLLLAALPQNILDTKTLVNMFWYNLLKIY